MVHHMRVPGVRPLAGQSLPCCPGTAAASTPPVAGGVAMPLPSCRRVQIPRVRSRSGLVKSISRPVGQPALTAMQHRNTSRRGRAPTYDPPDTPIMGVQRRPLQVHMFPCLRTMLLLQQGIPGGHRHCAYADCPGKANVHLFSRGPTLPVAGRNAAHGILASTVRQCPVPAIPSTT